MCLERTVDNNNSNQMSESNQNSQLLSQKTVFNSNNSNGSNNNNKKKQENMKKNNQNFESGSGGVIDGTANEMQTCVKSYDRYSLWPHKYQPMHTNDIIGNTQSIEEIMNWFKSYKNESEKEQYLIETNTQFYDYLDDFDDDAFYYQWTTHIDKAIAISGPIGVKFTFVWVLSFAIFCAFLCFFLVFSLCLLVCGVWFAQRKINIFVLFFLFLCVFIKINSVGKHHQFMRQPWK